MGMAKRLWMEQEDYVWEDTSVQFKCPECHEESDGECEIPKTDYELTMDILDDVCLQCSECGTEFDSEVTLSNIEQSIKLTEYPDVEVAFETIYFEPQPDWDDDYYFDRPDSPSDIFYHSVMNINKFIATLAEADGTSAMNKMIFSHSFSAFETYLCDTFLNLIFRNNTYRNVFIEKFDNFKKTTVTMEELRKLGATTADEIINRKVTRLVKGISFHNLGRVSDLFRIFKINVFASDEDKETLFKSVEYRHHCVHRNGNDLEGNILDVYTKDYIQNISNAMNATVINIEDKILATWSDDIGV